MVIELQDLLTQRSCRRCRDIISDRDRWAMSSECLRRSHEATPPWWLAHQHGVQIGRQLGAAMRSHSDCVIAGGIGERTGVGHVGAGRVVAVSIAINVPIG
jgi:hypothetical protein